MESLAADLSAGRAYHLLCSMVAPRPIAWVTSQDAAGRTNAAPFSWFQAVCADPPMVMVAVVDRPAGLKDTARNVLETQEFVVNIARGGQLEALVATSAELAHGENELDAVGLASSPARAVAPPRIDGCAGWLECRLVEHHRYGRDKATTVLVGEVVHVGLADDVATERGMLDPVAAQLPARLGGDDYLRVTDTFPVRRPQS